MAKWRQESLNDTSWRELGIDRVGSRYVLHDRHCNVPRSRFFWALDVVCDYMRFRRVGQCGYYPAEPPIRGMYVTKSGRRTKAAYRRIKR